MTEEARIHSGGKDSLNKWYRKTESYTEKNESRTYTICKKTSKWITNLNVRLDSIKTLEENIGRTFFHISPSKIFLTSPPRVIMK